MLKIKFLLSFGICCVLLSGSSGCRRSETELLAFVPSDSTAILIVNWKTVKNDNDLKSLIKGDDFEGQMRRFGVESAAVNEVIVFGATNSRAGLLLRGAFDRRKVADRLKSDGWIEDSIDGRKIYSNANDYLSLPTDGVLIAGTREGVSAALQTGRSSRENIKSTSSFKKIKASTPIGTSPITAFLIAPEGTLDMADAALTLTAGATSLFGWGEIGGILKKLNVAAGAGFTIAHGSTSEKYAVNLCVLMRDEQAASLAAGTLNLMKNLSSAVANTGDRENLQGFNITRQEKVLSIKMEMPREALTQPDAR